MTYFSYPVAKLFFPCFKQKYNQILVRVEQFVLSTGCLDNSLGKKITDEENEFLQSSPPS